MTESGQSSAQRQANLAIDYMQKNMGTQNLD